MDEISCFQLMNQIDNISESITDQQYKDLCDMVKALFEKEEKVHSYYRVWYVNVYTTIVTDDSENGLVSSVDSHYDFRFNNKLIKLTHEEYVKLKTDIEHDTRRKCKLFNIGESMSELELLVDTDNGTRCQHICPATSAHLNYVYRIEPAPLDA